MPNKTIYVSDGDMPLYQRAQEYAGGNLSAAISAALKRYIDVEESRTAGFEEIVVRVGVGAGRKVRFMGVLLGTWMDATPNTVHHYNVYRTQKGKFVLHHSHGAEYTMVDAEGKPAGWRGYLGIGNIKYGSAPAESSTRHLRHHRRASSRRYLPTCSTWSSAQRSSHSSRTSTSSTIDVAGGVA